jgi:hypothetical protein
MGERASRKLKVSTEDMSGLRPCFADRRPIASCGVVLHEPAALGQLLVNLLTCFLFGRHGRRSPQRCLSIIRAGNAEVQHRSDQK